MRRLARWTGRRRFVAAVVAASLVGVMAGSAIRGGASSDSAGAPAQRPSAPADDGQGPPEAGETAGGPGPRSAVAGVGVGFDRSEPGAVAAATSYATASQSWTYLADEDVVEAVEAVVVPAARGELVTQVVDDVRLLRDELQEASGTVWFVVAPLATRLDVYSASHAVVQVWVVRVLAADGVAVPQSGWQTLTLELQWNRGDWRVADVTETDGPTPQLEAGLRPWSASYLDETLSGFVRVGVR